MLKKLCTRKTDELGRMVLPQEARNILDIKCNQSLDIFTGDNSIVIRRNNDMPSCILCGESENELKEIKHVLICAECAAEIKDI